MRDYAAELAAYAALVAKHPDVGWPFGWEIKMEDGRIFRFLEGVFQESLAPAVLVALCESHLMGILAESDEWLLYWSQTSASVGIQEQHYPTRLLALIAAVRSEHMTKKTEADHISAPGKMAERGAGG